MVARALHSRSPGPSPLRNPTPYLLLIDDHAVFRRGLKSILQDELRNAIFGEAGNAQQALEYIRQKRWDVAVLDITMPGCSGLELLQAIKKIRPEIRVLVLSMHAEEHYALRVLRAGAAGYVNKVKAPREIVDAVKEVMNGQSYLSPSVNKALLHQFIHGGQNSPHESLTGREFEVMRLMARGNSGKQIAADLGISIQTVSTHRGNLLRKMGFQSLAQIIRYAIEHRLID